MTTLAEHIQDFRTGLQDCLRRQGRIRLPDAMLGRVLIFIQWTLNRLPRAIARAQAGYTPPKPRTRPAGPIPAPKSDRAIANRAHPLPRKEGWLHPAMPVYWWYNGCVDHFRRILLDPEIAPHLTCPPVLRLLRPLCRTFGISDILPPRPPRAPRAPRAPPAEPRPRRAQRPKPVNTPAQPPQPAPQPTPQPSRRPFQFSFER